MRIYRMTATFGKLEHETLVLEPGLNVIQAENEWGKSTWCAFLMAMLYGLDTRTKTTKMALADKERYAPWSGSPMAGRVDLCWQGRDITIERKTKGRIPMGEFRAYETDTGLVVPELTAANCGQLLLGVEQSVFRRAGFVRFSDLPVTQDDALRRRLNALVTTGDESGEAERLERGLREVKNKCRYNRTGLIPQAEAQRDALEEKLRELDGLENQTRKLTSRLEEMEAWTSALENHRAALNYSAAQADAQRVAKAQEAWEQAKLRAEDLETNCTRLPSRDEAERKILQLRQFQEQWDAAQMELTMLPEPPAQPEPPRPFAGMDREHARQMVQEDTRFFDGLHSGKAGWMLFVLALLCLALGIALAVLGSYAIMDGFLALSAVLVLLGIWSRRKCSRARADLEKKYGAPSPEQWKELLEKYVLTQEHYRQHLAEYHSARNDLDARLAALETQKQSLCGAQSAQRVLEVWQQVAKHWEECRAARRDADRAQSYLQALQAMAKPVQRPNREDVLTYTGSETARLLSDAAAEQQRLQNRLGQYQGRMETLGDREQLEQQVAQVSARIRKLEETYAAAELGLNMLTQAKRELQRRFAPRITKRAQELLGQMTADRYRRLTLGEDFGLCAGAGEEDTLHEAMWRSDGTVDQLYLALRLAVAEELTPEAPLVLDDALVRFDDARMEAAIRVLAQMAKEKQVILFTCQGREKAAVSGIEE